MCGIIGEISRRGPIDRPLFDAMRDSLAHRGPDGAGTVILADGAVALGHRRLSIIDLTETGRQPMACPGERYWLTFNGEIYNYPELREELAELGHRFQGTGDSEVLLHAYQEWGEACLDRLAGMFAFAIWDDQARTLFLARDRFGIKPLYVYQGDGHAIFASDLRAIIRHPAVPRRIDGQALRLFFQLRHIPAPATIWAGIGKLPPGHCLTLDQNGCGTPRRYWHLACDRRVPPPVEARAEAMALLERSVREHLLSDVPVGMFLSGGQDSGAILALSRRADAEIPCYTIGFDGWDASEHAAAGALAGALGSPHKVRMLKGPDTGLFARVAEAYDEPLGGTSQWPTMALAELAGREVKVALGGDGGDEVLGGYRWYGQDGPASLSAYATQMTWPGLAGSDIGRLLPDLAAEAGSNPATFFAAAHDPALGPVKSLQMLDFDFFLPGVVLAKLDRAGMAFGLEARVPFLDHRFVEYVMGLDESVYRPGGQAKGWLSGLLADAAPQMARTSVKQGFGAPVSRYMEARTLAELARAGSAVRDGVVATGMVAELERNGAMAALYAVNLFTAWYERWVRW